MTSVRERETDPHGRLGGMVTVELTPPAGEQTADTERTILLPRISTDPVDELADRVRADLGRAVDALQVAAALEAEGHTDRAAQVEYGYSDVFALASEVFRRMGPHSPAHDRTRIAPASGDGWRTNLRPLSHGLLYVLPSAAFPAILAIVGLPGLVLGLVVAGTAGWILSGVAGYSAYRLVGLGRPRSAARLMRIAALAGLPLGGLLGAAVLPRAGLPLAVMMVAQLVYQMASTLLIFYRREAWLAVVMLPAVAFGAAYLVFSGATQRHLAVTAAAAGVLAAFCVALWATRIAHRAAAQEPAPRDRLWPQLPALLAVAGYGLCSALLLFHAQGPYLLSRLDIAAAALPLILSMGFVEWRTSRFRPCAVALTRRARRPGEFVAKVWRMIGREIAACLSVAALLGAAMLAGFFSVGMLSPAGVMMTAAHVMLAGAYYLAFLLVGRGRYGWLCLSIVLSMSLHVGVGALLGIAPWWGQDGSALADTSLYLGSVVLLQALFALGLVPVVGQVRHYR